MLKKFDYYMEGFVEAMEKIHEINDFIKTYSPEDIINIMNYILWV